MLCPTNVQHIFALVFFAGFVGHLLDKADYNKVVSSVPVQGFFRIRTRERNLDLLFVTLLAFARTGASADNGGNRKTLFNTLKN